MTSLNGYIQGLGGGEKRTVDKQGKEIKLSVFDNIDRVIVFNEAGETTQEHYDGTFNFNQLIHNGNFVDSSYWKIYTSSRGTFSANDNIGTITYNGSYSGGYDCALAPNGYSIPLTSSHKYLLTVSVKSDFATDIGVEIGTGIGSLDRTLTVGVWTDYSIIAQRPNWSSGTVVLIKPVNSTIVNGSQLQFKNCMFIDLTDMFGSTKADELYAMEQAEAGSGVAWFRSYFDDDYYPYNSGTQTTIPSPLFPEDIVGIGTRNFDGTYRVSIDYDDGDEHYGTITASGLAYPLYEGDVLDFVNGKVIRANGYKVLDGSENWQAGIGDFELTISDMLSGSYLDGKSDRFKVISAGSLDDNTIKLGDNNQKLYILTNISGVTDVATWKTWLSNNNTTIVYPLATPVDEYITLTGDISDIGTARVMADGTLTVKYDKVEMAIRKYSSPPDWSKIGYSETPSFILDGFDYSKQIYDSWTPAASYASKFRGDKALKFFPEVDLTGANNYSAMFQESGILSTPPLTIGDGSNTVINSQGMFQTTQIEKIELTTSEATQKVQIANIFNGCTMLKNAKLTLSASGSMQYAFADCNRLERIEDGLETSDVTSISEAFRACSSLLYLYELDLNSCTTCYRAFYNCTSLYSAPYLKNIGNGVNFQQMFWNCSSLKVLPLYNLGSPSNLTNMFQGTGSNLEEASRINILVMLATCTYSGTKTLAHLGFTASMYSAASWQALPHYNDFVSAGWSIGYN